MAEGAVPFWGDDPDWWDTIKISDWVFADTNIDIDGELDGDFDIPKAAQSDGAPSNYKGYIPCQPKVTVLLYTREHWNAYQALLNVIQPKPGKLVPPILAIVHPKFQLYRKEKFQLKKLPFLKDVAPNQKSVTFEFIEYFPAAKKTPTGTGGFTSGEVEEGDSAGKLARGSRASGAVTLPSETKPSKTSTKP
jgi:hypothetical protein